VLLDQQVSVRDDRGMLDDDWKEFVTSLVEAKRSLASAWSILDGIDGAAPGGEQALTAALAAIDAIFGIEEAHEANQDVAAPGDVQAFWDKHGQLPGFAVGT
jgi:hypothetical protein